MIIRDFTNETQEDIQYKLLQSLVILEYRDGASISSLLKLLCDGSNLLKIFRYFTVGEDYRGSLQIISSQVFQFDRFESESHL